jgi:hypothetical protein
MLKKTKAECPWIEGAVANTSENVDCKFCGWAMSSKVPTCPNCKAVVNKKLYEKLMAEE